MTRFLLALSLIALAAGGPLHAQDGSGSGAAAEPAAGASDGSGSAAAAEAPPPAKQPGPGKFHPRGAMAMKAVVCKSIEEAKGKAGSELAQAIEEHVAQFRRSNYRLSAIMPGDPPIACFHHLGDPSKLPRGAR